MGAPAHVIAEWARHCHCCPVCSVKPCDGVMAGGICDSLECVCDGAIDFDGEGPSDASPLTDDLDDATIHEPMTKESDMSEARASERADLAELRRLMESAKRLKLPIDVLPLVLDREDYDFIYAACNALPGLIAEVERLTRERAEARKLGHDAFKIGVHHQERAAALESELSRASATAQDMPAWYGMNNSWPLHDVLSELIRGAEILLDEKDYDGHGHERIATAKKRAREILVDIGLALPSQEPAATASRTVSEQEVLALIEELEDMNSGMSLSSFHHGLLAKAIAALNQRLIPAPSVAELAKCGTPTQSLAYMFWQLPMSARREISFSLGLLTEADMLLPEQERYVEVFKRAKERDLVGALLEAVVAACPDCTPASAEQTKCGYCGGNGLIQVVKPSEHCSWCGSELKHEDDAICPECNGTGRACHAEQVKVS